MLKSFKKNGRNIFRGNLVFFILYFMFGLGCTFRLADETYTKYMD